MTNSRSHYVSEEDSTGIQGRNKAGPWRTAAYWLVQPAFFYIIQKNLLICEMGSSISIKIYKIPYRLA